MARVLIVVALVAGAIALWLGLRETDAPAPEKPRDMRTMDSGGPPPPPADAAVAATHTPTEAPRLPTLVDAAVVPAMPVDQQFGAQTRDAAWAAPTEAELRKRVGAVREIHVEAAECRESLCKLVIAGSQGAIATAIDELQTDKRGLRNWANRWVLGAPEKRGDALALTAYVRFERNDRPQPDQGD